ncbi:muscarinic acetylcholine receptor M3, partial [Biomphalaria pfeifferi]
MALSGNTTSNSDVNSRALWPAVAYTVLMMTVGTVGNILVLVVYRRQYRKSVTRLFIFALAALDIGNCLITMPAELVILIHFTSFPSATWCKATRYLTYIFNGSSSIILIAISMD